MKKETYYINELTGEVFHSEKGCADGEKAEAKRIEDEIKQNFKLIQNYCHNHNCPDCPFFHGNGTLCIATAFFDDYFEGE